MPKKTTTPKLQPCPAVQGTARFDNTTGGIQKGFLRCMLVRGHEGNHVCQTPEGKPYEFPNA